MIWVKLKWVKGSTINHRGSVIQIFINKNFSGNPLIQIFRGPSDQYLRVEEYAAIDWVVAWTEHDIETINKTIFNLVQNIPWFLCRRWHGSFLESLCQVAQERELRLRSKCSGLCPIAMLHEKKHISTFLAWLITWWIKV